MAEPLPITKSLDGIMKSLRGTDRIQIGGVFGKWADAVGANVAFTPHIALALTGSAKMPT